MSVISTAAPKRFIALDVFRGATIFLMILVNTAGAGAPPFAQLVHAKWIGFTLADLVFPTFLFAMGNAMSFALRKPLPTGPYVKGLCRRAAIIFLLGFLMYWFPFVARGETGWAFLPFDHTRIPGVLQRLALCYLLAGLLVRWLGVRQIVLACIVLLLGYWGILLAFSEPGLAYDKYANIGTKIDLWLIGPAHLYKKDNGFDPEGLLGTLPATVNVLAGYLAGVAILRGASLARTVRLMAVAGVGLVLAGLAWAPWFPIAKKLWTGSFVLLTTGLDLILLAGLIALVELAGRQRGTSFFTILGRNPLAIYLFSELFVIVLEMVRIGPQGGVYHWIGVTLFQPLAPGPVGSLLCAFAYTMVCWAVAWAMDRKGLILKA
ncbi:heparan-alpha-glucosaminide N-acetyltransferase domain-containing protein [Niveispirillum sp. BGYR6]|uniref:acyltransferase family protein n=1 Tax=Niveispirillum sp. BGYR6 TaxID=2971249 RepID=UPI0022B94952|nr:heparan-alpha-glucosaminide N-acetyltransferase domain-containing protein [Niveispirillum sp. BGYR6]MDG5497344.1 heparan-alpha-glucosaminide N-acetyltransferase domain-containing protein [Niveispirillum sp. BGYR6]